MENEKNGGLINKKASEEQLVSFCWLGFWYVQFQSSHFSLTVGYFDFFLEHSWRLWILGDLEKEANRRARNHKRTSRSGATT